MDKLKIGDTLYYVTGYDSRDRRHGRPITISKVGREYYRTAIHYGDSQLAGPKIRIRDLSICSEFSYDERVWLSEAAYKEHERALQAWNLLWDCLYRSGHSRVPNGVSVENIQKASRLLGLEEKSDG